jgi:hypothetical protein
MIVRYKDRAYRSVSECCRINGKDPRQIYKRMERGMTLEEAMDAKFGNGNQCHDHLGEEFCSEEEMCKAWGIKSATYRKRRKAGWELEEALTVKV